MAIAEIAIAITVEMTAAKQFISDVSKLEELSLKLAHVGRQKAGMGPVITEASSELHRIALNLSRVKMA